jgi:hypothetical protein
MLRPAGTPPPRPPDTTATNAAAGLAVSVLDARAHIDVAIPNTPLRAKMRLLGRGEARAVRQETRSALVAAGLAELAKSHTPELYREWIEELATRTLAVAVRDPHTLGPLAALEEWEVCDDQQIGALWERYKDLESDLDPLAKLDDLDPDVETAIFEAAKKKDARSLIAFGSCALASFATSSVCRPAS